MIAEDKIQDTTILKKKDMKINLAMIKHLRSNQYPEWEIPMIVAYNQGVRDTLRSANNKED